MKTDERCRAEAWVIDGPVPCFPIDTTASTVSISLISDRERVDEHRRIA